MPSQSQNKFSSFNKSSSLNSSIIHISFNCSMSSIIQIQIHVARTLIKIYSYFKIQSSQQIICRITVIHIIFIYSSSFFFNTIYSNIQKYNSLSKHQGRRSTTISATNVNQSTVIIQLLVLLLSTASGEFALVHKVDSKVSLTPINVQRHVLRYQ